MKSTRPKDMPEIPVASGALPLIGHLLPILNKRKEFFLENAEKFKSPFWIHLGFGRWQVVLPIGATFKVLKNKFTDSDVIPEFISYITNNSIIIADGKWHRRMRGAINAPFTPRGLSAANIGQITNDVIDSHLDVFEANAMIKVLDVTGLVALDIIFRMLGVPKGEVKLWRDKYSQFLATLAIFIPIDLPGFPLRKAKNAGIWMSNRFGELIDEAIQKGDKTSIIGAMAHGKDEEGNQLTKAELLGNLKFLGLAGHETTAAVTGWMLLELARRPEMQETIIEEAIAQSAPPLSPSTLRLFPKAEALFRECLRIYPPLGDGPVRNITNEVEMEGFQFKAGTKVVPATYAISSNPERYPNPDEVRLERWTELGRKPKQEELIQFGSGPHFCLGYHLALLEGTQFIVKVSRLLHKKKLRLAAVGKFPKPSYGALTGPPNNAKVKLVVV